MIEIGAPGKLGALIFFGPENFGKLCMGIWVTFFTARRL
jgi:hypothetical protein